MALELSLGISWQFGLLAVLSMLLFPHFRGRYAFIFAAIGYSLVDIVPAIIAGNSLGSMALALLDANSTISVGLWTLTGALAWGAVGFLFTLQKPNGSPATFAKLGIGGTLIFDAITGPILSPLIWGMPFWEALVGQLPFTAKHLIGIAAVSIILAPLLFPSINKTISKKDWPVLKPSSSLS